MNKKEFVQQIEDAWRKSSKATRYNFRATNSYQHLDRLRHGKEVEFGNVVEMLEKLGCTLAIVPMDKNNRRLVIVGKRDTD